jgi:uncharacterized protein (TIGR03437 family)
MRWLLVPFLLVSAAQAQNYTTTTIFGRTLVTEGGSATTSLLRYPISIAVDSAGNTYIADQNDNRVWKVDSSGKITTFAGNGTPYYGGDNGPANKAALNSPVSVAVDASNNVYIADYGNYRVRKVTTDGTITTIVGSGSPVFSGDGGPASKAGIVPGALAVDKSGNLYIADNANIPVLSGVRVREVSVATGNISTIAGTGTPGYSGDNGPATGAELFNVTAVAVDGSGNVYVADDAAFVIREINTKGVITTIGGTGAIGYSGDGSKATLAQMVPYGLALDPTGTMLYLSEPFTASTVRSINLTTGIISLVAGQAGFFGYGGDGGTALLATLWAPYGLAVDSSKNVLICDTLNQRVRKVTVTTGLIATIAGTSSSQFLNHPRGISLDSKGNLNIADTGDDETKQLNLSTGTVQNLTQYPEYPQGVAEDSTGNLYATSQDWYVWKYSGGQWTQFAGNGTNGYAGDNGRATQAEIGLVTSIAVDSSNDIYIADDQYYRIRKIDTTGAITLVAGAGAQSATGDGGKATSGGLDPFDIALDKSGNIYVADRANNRVRKIIPGGNISTVAGTGTAGFSGDNGQATAATLNGPTGVAVDSSGNIFICDQGNALLRKVTTDGVIHTVAGDGTSYPFSGDGPALVQNLDPFRAAVDASGNVYISDWANDRIRKLVPVNATSLAIVSGNNQTGSTGAALSQKLTVMVTGSDGNPFGGATVNFAVTTGSATLSAPSVQTANDGTASVAVTLGSTPGPVTVTASVAGLTSVTFNLTAVVAQITPAALTIVSGNSQSGTTGTTLAGKLVVKVTGSDGNPYAGATVTFTVASGSATLNPSTPQQTASDGTASTAVTLGNTAGTVTVTASVTGLTAVTFTLTATPNNGPQISAGGVVSAGLSSPPIQVASPNAILSIFGQNFAPAGTLRKVAGSDLVNGLVPTNLIGVCVTFGTAQAPIFLVTPGQLNIQAPQLPASGTVSVQVTTGCGTANPVTSNTVTVNVAAAAPEFFYSSNSGTAANPIAAIDPNGGGVGDPARLGAGFGLAYPGEVIQAFATGLGLTNPAFSPGQLPPSGAQVSGLTVSIDGTPLSASAIQYAGVAPLNAGLYQVNIALPAGLTPGDHTITMAVNGVGSPAGSYISVGPSPAH